MKKLLTLVAVAMVFTLAGCKDAYVDISTADETLVTVGDEKITKGDVFEILKSSYGASFTLNEALNKICTLEKIEVTDAMKKTAKEQLETLKTNATAAGTDFAKQLKDNGYKSEDDYIKQEIYPSLQQKELVKNYVNDKKKALLKTYSPRKAQIIEAESKEKAESALKAVTDGGNMSDAATAYGTTTTYKGEENIYTSKSTLPTAVFDKIKAAEKNGVISSVIEDTTNSKYYVVNVTNTDASSFEAQAIEAIITDGATDLTTAASVYYLKKYEFKVYDKNVYDGLLSANEEYINY